MPPFAIESNQWNDEVFKIIVMNFFPGLHTLTEKSYCGDESMVLSSLMLDCLQVLGMPMLCCNCVKTMFTLRAQERGTYCLRRTTFRLQQKTTYFIF